MLKFSDSHFHSLLAQDVDYGVVFENLHLGIDVATSPEDTDKILASILSHKNIYTTIAAGPWRAKTRAENDSIIANLIEIYKNAEKRKIAAIGEIGLDYHHSSYAAPDIQKDLFFKQIQLSSLYSLPLILHIRDSFSDVYDIISPIEFRYENILHCFSSDKTWAKKFLDKGFFIAFGGSITYKSNEIIRDAVRYVPLSKILLETDSPYLSPVPVRGCENTPLNLVHIISMIAEIKGTTCENVISETNNNLEKFIAQREREYAGN